jgi:hypothetical protein
LEFTEFFRDSRFVGQKTVRIEIPPCAKMNALPGLQSNSHRMSRPGAVLGATDGSFATIAVGSVLMARRAQYEAGVTKELGVFEALVLKSRGFVTK